MLPSWLKIGVSVALLAAILWQLDALGDIGKLFAQAAPAFVVLAFVVITVDRLLMTFKWLTLLKSRGVHLPLFEGFKIYCTAMIWGTFLPATVGADIVRGIMTSRQGLDQYEVFASIVVERVVGFFCALVLGLAGIVILAGAGVADPRLTPVWWSGTAVLVGSAVVVLLSFSDTLFERITELLPRRVRQSSPVDRLRHFHGVYRAYAGNGSTIAVFFALTLTEQYLAILASWIIALALHVDVGLLFVAGVVPLAMLISRLPISIGLGVYEGVFVLLMSLGGIRPAESLSIALAGRIVQTLAWMPWWLLYALQTRRFRPPGSVAPT
jgi:uncharacterized protein (TIRG00374 family)